jgi:flagellar operon protein
MSIANPILYPNVSQVPAKTDVNPGRASGEAPIQKGEFDQSLNQAMKQPSLNGSESLQNPMKLPNVNAQGLKFSAHAQQRLRERQIQFDQEMMSKMNDAITKADAKGLQDTLVLTDKAALIVSVPSRTVITAMDRNNLSGNVFTNIDGAVII